MRYPEVVLFIGEGSSSYRPSICIPACSGGSWGCQCVICDVTRRIGRHNHFRVSWWFLRSVIFSHHCIRSLEVPANFIWFKTPCDR